MNDLSDIKCNLRVVGGKRFCMSGHRPVQVVDLINLESCKRGFTPLDSPVFSSNDDAPSTDALAEPIPNEGGEIRLCDFELGKSIKSCQAIKTIPALFVGDK